MKLELPCHNFLNNQKVRENVTVAKNINIMRQIINQGTSFFKKQVFQQSFVSFLKDKNP